MKKRIVLGSLIILVLGTIAVGLIWMRPSPEDSDKGNAGSSKGETVKSVAGSKEYICPMHPDVRSDRPGACPVCGMNLVRKSGQEATDEHDEPLSLGAVALSPSKQVLANVSTSIAHTMALQAEIRAAGLIEYAEPNFQHISTRFPGRIEKLYLSYTGQRVKKGDPVADLYSPEAITAQQEYLLAKYSYEQVKLVHEYASGGALDLVQQSRQKLLYWGFTEEQIAELDRSHEVKSVVTIYSPIGGTMLKKNVDPQHYVATGEDLYDVADLSVVWLYADVYEFETPSLRLGDPIHATSEAFPGEIFIGKITFIHPTVDPASRTVRIRAEFPNPRERLKPGMFAQAVMKIGAPPMLVVPTSAVLITGHRQVVWIQKSEGVFEPRAVTLGRRTPRYWQVISGIAEGDIVVTSGGYLLDSESQLNVGTPEHVHGNVPQSPTPQSISGTEDCH